MEANAESECVQSVRSIHARVEEKLRHAGHVSLATIFRDIKRLGFKQHQQYTIPTIRLASKVKRLKFVLQKLHHSAEGVYEFDLPYNTIFVDEKPFKSIRPKRPVWTRPQDVKPPPHRAVNKTSGGLPVMALAAVGVPQGDFNGLIGVYFCVDWVPTKRRSKNCARDDLVPKPISCTAKSYLNMLTKDDGVLADIRRVFPNVADNVVQQDNATPHVGKDNIRKLLEAGQQHGFYIQFVQQPPQSPELNILVLAFLHSWNVSWCLTAFEYINSNNLLRRFDSLSFISHEILYCESLESCSMFIADTVLYGEDDDFKVPHTCVEQTNKLPSTQQLIYLFLQQRYEKKTAESKLIRAHPQILYVRTLHFVGK